MYIGTLEGRYLVQYIMSYLSTIYLIPDIPNNIKYHDTFEIPRYFARPRHERSFEQVASINYC